MNGTHVIALPTMLHNTSSIQPKNLLNLRDIKIICCKVLLELGIAVKPKIK